MHLLKTLYAIFFSALVSNRYFPFLAFFTSFFIAASTPRVEIFLVSRSGPECSKNSEHEEWRSKEEEVREGSGVQSGRPRKSLSRLWFSHVSFITLYDYCLPYTSHKAHRGRDQLFHSCFKNAPDPGTFSPLLWQPLITSQELEL